jgi:hypothetical protein
MQIVPTPAAARYIATGEPRPPAPMQSTRAAFKLLLPFHPHFRKDQVTAVALDLVGVERHGRRRGRAHTAGTDGMMLSVSPGFTAVSFATSTGCPRRSGRC